MLIAAIVGFLFGSIGSIPVAGPISALVVTRGIQGRFRAGVYIALGGGIAEAVYAFLAFWGFSTFLTKYPIVTPISRGVAAVILTALAVTLVRKRVVEPSTKFAPRDSALGSFALGASICLLNPTLIATWTAVVTTLYSSEAIQLTGAQALPFALGVCSGIAAWFLTLLWMIRRHKDRFSPASLSRFIRGVGFALFAVAAWFGWRFIAYFL
jgi:threonine/homoserine/homoserine lactone efflux protein